MKTYFPAEGGCHTIRQVAAGYVGGFIVATLAVLLL